jgi:hypothetical protein
MREEITVQERPRAYRYRWLNPPAAPFSLMVRGAESDWTFRPAGAGTAVDWTYTFELTTPLGLPAGGTGDLVVQPLDARGARGVAQGVRAEELLLPAEIGAARLALELAGELSTPRRATTPRRCTTCGSPPGACAR